MMTVLQQMVEAAQYASATCWRILATQGLTGFMSRRGHPYDNEGRKLNENPESRSRIPDGL